MVLIADSGAIYGLHDRRDLHHRSLWRVIEQEIGPILISQVHFIEDVIASIFTLVRFTPIDVIRSRDLIATYRDMDLGLAGASA